MTTLTTPATQIYRIVIKASPEQIWEAITSPEFTTRYFFGAYVDSTFEPGAPYNSYSTDRTERWIEGEVLEADPPRLLRHTHRGLFDPEQAAEPSSRVTWEIEPQGNGTALLTVTHDRLEGSPRTAKSVSGGWTTILSGLKTLLETGEPLVA